MSTRVRYYETYPVVWTAYPGLGRPQAPPRFPSSYVSQANLVGRAVAAPPARVGALDGGECDRPTNFGVWPSEVNAFKARLLLVANAWDGSVDVCKALPDAERAAWKAFYAAFKPFAEHQQDWYEFGSYGEWVQTCAYSRFLDQWKVRLERYCTLAGVSDVSSGGALDVLKYAAIGAGVVAVAAVLVTYAPSIKAVLPGGRR